jgi:ketosteroid isomerase-like protein
VNRQQIATIQVECQQFINKVATLMDSAQWQELANCYTEDGVLFRPSDPDNGVQGRDAILASFRARPPRASCHLIANSVFEVQAADKVIAHSRVWLISGETSAQLVIANNKLLVGSFIDQLVYVDNKWLIQRRHGSIELQYGQE